jgi:hypothetical protein
LHRFQSCVVNSAGIMHRGWPGINTLRPLLPLRSPARTSRPADSGKPARPSTLDPGRV